MVIRRIHPAGLLAGGLVMHIHTHTHSTLSAPSCCCHGRKNGVTLQLALIMRIDPENPELSVPPACDQALILFAFNMFKSNQNLLPLFSLSMIQSVLQPICVVVMTGTTTLLRLRTYVFESCPCELKQGHFCACCTDSVCAAGCVQDVC